MVHLNCFFTFSNEVCFLSTYRMDVVLDWFLFFFTLLVFLFGPFLLVNGFHHLCICWMQLFSIYKSLVGCRRKELCLHYHKLLMDCACSWDIGVTFFFLLDFALCIFFLSGNVVFWSCVIYRERLYAFSLSPQNLKYWIQVYL